MSDKTYQLIVRKGPNPGQIFPLLSASISIGRDPMSDIAISDPEISRYHAQLVQTSAGYQLQDMGSTNGTFVNEQRLGADPELLISGQKVQLGSGVVLDYQITSDDPLATIVETTLEESREETPEVDTDFAEASLESELPPLPDLEEPVAPPFPSDEPFAQDSPPPPRVVAGDDSADQKKRRRNTIIILVILLLLCCCCAFLLSGYYVWGDPLLEYLLDLMREQGIQ